MKKAFAVITAILLLTIPVCTSHSEDYSITVGVDKVRDIVAFESSFLTAEVSGKQPSVRFYYTGDGLNLTHFRISLEKIVEYTEDLEIAQECNIEAWRGIYGDPHTIQDEGGSEVGVGVHQAFLKYPRIPFLIVFTEFSMYYANFTETRQLGTLNMTTTTPGGVELRTTIRVIDWPFRNPDTGRLALVFRIEKEIPGETSEQHHFRLEEGESESVLYIVGDDTEVVEGVLKWGNRALTSNATAYYLTPIEAILNEMEHEAELIMVYGCMNTSVAGMLEQTLTIGVVEENAEFIVHPTPPTLTPQIIIVAAVVTFVVLVAVIVKRPPRKD
ncbi:MAG: hypothetical protein OEZ25_06525 [Candidatus Bathyarchaeota archaeon]|nr:hypothetical protein [Candidatus Bathyarchaeota archaeon]